MRPSGNVVKETIKQETATHLVILSHETGEKNNPRLHKFRAEGLTVINCGIFIETAEFLLDLPY